jgi:hypothetical protein
MIRWPVLLGGVLAAAPLRAQGAWELGPQGLVLLAEPAMAAAGLYGAVRPGGRLRLAATAEAGTQKESVATRGEVLFHFLLVPGARRGAGVYGLGGAAWSSGPREGGYLVLGVGVEWAPAGRSGWALEAGVGGGVRIAAGYRWRWFRPKRQ